MIQEEWRTVKDFPDYAVSNMGRVKRLVNPKCGFPAGRYFSLKPFANGYSVVQLFNGKINKKIYVHHLVLEAFVSPRREGFVCNHKDCIRTNNYVDNLEWVTQSENVVHEYRTGRVSVPMRGEHNGFSRLKDGEVWLIKKLLASKRLTQKSIAKMFRSSQAHISLIATNKEWKHIVYP